MSTALVETMWEAGELSTAVVDLWASPGKPAVNPRPVHTASPAASASARGAAPRAPAVVHGSTPSTTIARDLHHAGVVSLRCEQVVRTREAP